jgi:HD superfamily phosphohydrolase
MAMALLVYPGAVHTRLHHSLGAYHLMCNAITELRSKGVEITAEEEIGAKAAILLHDIGHGPFSHALENVLLPGVHHETMSLEIMHLMNEEFGGQLQTAIDIFTNKYHKKFLHQLVSGQLDVDRMDYLTRDSFFTGVNEGVIGYDRILKMLVVHKGELMVEEKAIYSIEKFLVARRLMYWQVYLHKTVLVAEKMLIKITERVREIYKKEDGSLVTGTPIDYFLSQDKITVSREGLEFFCALDDYDFIHAIKVWAKHPDKVLQVLCNGILNRQLLKIKFQAEPFEAALIQVKKAEAREKLHLEDDKDIEYFVFTGDAANTMYKTNDESINILFKDGKVKDISQVDNALIHKTLSSPVKKFYICFLA